jgi:CDP-glucose 4,6-dehydratase
VGQGRGPLEELVINQLKSFNGLKVLVTGHTGFKGGWLSLWLSRLGASVHGYALAPNSEPCLFNVADIESHMASSTIADVRDAAALERAVVSCDPDLVFHMAAQPLVLESYSDPIGTYATNVMGSVHLMNACRLATRLRAIVVVTSDKCYENREVIWAYRENDAMGGHDPYSSSKGCTELVVASMARSYFSKDGAASVATARAGNVIGGGDWSKDRLVVDILNGLIRGEPVMIRRPSAIRPWQHVLEPLSGYLDLALHLLAARPTVCEGWNFGPSIEGERTVGELAALIANMWGRPDLIKLADQTGLLHEATLLKLDVTKARVGLGWRPRLTFEEALRWTIDWHRARLGGADMTRTTLDQIERFEMMLPRVAIGS